MPNPDKPNSTTYVEDDEGHPGRKACPQEGCHGHVIVFCDATTGSVHATHTRPLCEWWMFGLLLTSGNGR